MEPDPLVAGGGGMTIEPLPLMCPAEPDPLDAPPLPLPLLPLLLLPLEPPLPLLPLEPPFPLENDPDPDPDPDPLSRRSPPRRFASVAVKRIDATTTTNAVENFISVCVGLALLCGYKGVGQGESTLLLSE